MDGILAWLERNWVHCGFLPENPFAPHSFYECLHWRWINDPWLHIPVWVGSSMLGYYLVTQVKARLRARRRVQPGPPPLSLRYEVARVEAPHDPTTDRL